MTDEAFCLDPDFIAKYKKKKPKFGFNGLGELVFYRTYSRVLKDGTKERLWQVFQRVVEGCYEIQRRHQKTMRLPWCPEKAQESAQEMFKRMWDFKFLPPGRGLWMMGTDFIWSRGSAAANNCAFTTTDPNDTDDAAEPFCFLMDMSMLGVGVGFDTKGAGHIAIGKPGLINKEPEIYTIPDSREGWVESLRKLLHSYFYSDRPMTFDYSNVRPAGSPINGFGGTAAGPDILKQLHEGITALLETKIDQLLTSVDITDIMNLIGKCIVAGNVRRTAEIAFGEANDDSFRSMKNPLKTLQPEDHAQWFEATGRCYASNPPRKLELIDFNDNIPDDRLTPAIETFNALNNHRWASNNSIMAQPGMNYADIGSQIASNGEPGLIYLDAMQHYGRMIDGKQPGIDGKVKGSNPCLSGEMRLLTNKGYLTVEELWERGGYQEYDSMPTFTKHGMLEIASRRGMATATNVYRTSVNASLLKVTFDNSCHIRCTRNHKFIVVGEDGTERRVDARDLVAGHKVPWFNGPNPFTRVVDVVPDGSGPTFCLTEPEHHEIIVNNIIIGNCSEMSLESMELCTLTETFPANHSSADDYMKTLKYAYLYGKSVTLLSTHNPRTNQVMLRNRRIGLSQSGIVQAIAKFGRHAMMHDFCDRGYRELKKWDKVYSDWLGVPKSIKMTTVKPSGSVSLLSGATPGIHYPEAPAYWRLVRLAKDSELVTALAKAGYKIEPAISDPERTVVCYFAVSDRTVQGVHDISIWEQMSLAADYQHYWADNQVSCTVKFNNSERSQITKVLEAFEDRLKGISFLPHFHGYAQAPYQPCTHEEVEEYNAKLKPVDYSAYLGEAQGAKFCDGDSCTI